MRYAKLTSLERERIRYHPRSNAAFQAQFYSYLRLERVLPFASRSPVEIDRRPQDKRWHQTNLRLSVAPAFTLWSKSWRPLFRAGERPALPIESTSIGWADRWVPTRIGSQTNA